ncbi:glucose-6-phosphate isomerase [Bordetella sp. FB-8]|uniref:glucose-6-phosphate isomerase n=1 Tax=Bordetella sp. FB-8 TaxID=1159870 RepID=UPI0003704E01|nr:glucose-6-phosphate isomerase [Bordetella sp. FB-8]
MKSILQRPRPVGMPMAPLTESPAWQALVAHHRQIRDLHLRDFFVNDPFRRERMVLYAAGLYFDYSKHRVTGETIALLLRLVRECDMAQRIEAMFTGVAINVTEQRTTLRAALCASFSERTFVDDNDVLPGANVVLERMTAFCEDVRAGLWRGHTGRPIRNIVNIGVGGYGLGPDMAYEALRHYSQGNMKFRFVSSADEADFFEKTRDLDPEETMFIICSQSFSAAETLGNVRLAREWSLRALGDQGAIRHHFVAVSTNAQGVADFGIDTEYMFRLRDQVAGRYSMNSAGGLSIMMAIGPENFCGLLAGIHAMDRHFRTAPFERNLPVLMALLSIWYSNFFGAQTVAVLPYDHYMKRFPVYLQQLAVQSNGKHVSCDETRFAYPTGQIYWGEPGANEQHAVYPLGHQDTHVIPCDFIGFGRSLDPHDPTHDLMTANLFAQTEALAFGTTVTQAETDGTPPWLASYLVCEGNRPSSTILAECLTPETLGKLVALYEHSIFTQGTIRNIDSFDQRGFEPGKRIAVKIQPEAREEAPDWLDHDSSTNALIRQYRYQRAS